MIIDKDLYEKISRQTMTDYEPSKLFNSENKVYIQDEVIEGMFEDLLIEIERKEEKIKDIEEDIEENYRPISLAEKYDMSDRDFI